MENFPELRDKSWTEGSYRVPRARSETESKTLIPEEFRKLSSQKGSFLLQEYGCNEVCHYPGHLLVVVEKPFPDSDNSDFL